MSNTITFKNLIIGTGDKVKVIQKVVESGKERRQIFSGTVIKIKKGNKNQSITIRRMGVNLVGIEKIYSLNNPSLEEILVTKEGYKGSRKSKLYYIRNKSKKEIDKLYFRNKRKN